MSTRHHILQSRIKELQDRWQLLTQKLNALSKQRDLETRADEKMRIDVIINDTESDRRQVEEELNRFEQELNALATPVTAAAPVVPNIPRQPAGPIELFYSYAHEDETLRKSLETHLALLRREGIISAWHDRGISAGKEWEGEINQHLESAQIILLLVSADFVASDYCWKKEVARAMERHQTGEARVIPIILRSVDWHTAPFGKLQALPKDAKPVVNWPDQDEAFTDIARGIRRVAKELMEKK